MLFEVYNSRVYKSSNYAKIKFISAPLHLLKHDDRFTQSLENNQ